MILQNLIKKYYQRCRVYAFKCLSTNKRIEGVPTINQPVLFAGEGRVVFGRNVWLGYFPSPGFYNGAIHIEPRKAGASIVFGNNIYINNNFSVICEGSSIHIGDDVLVGTNVEIIDSDFHSLDPARRNSGEHSCRPVVISRNVFLGSNVRILKGVTIGENSVVANGAVVSSSFPANVVIGGNPATIIMHIDDERRTAGPAS